MSSILFICSAFAPRNVIGSIRPSKMAKYFVRLGHDVTVCMPELVPGEPQDSLLMGPEMERVTRIQVPYGRAYHKVRKAYQRGNGSSGSGGSGLGSGLKRFARFAFSLFNDFTWSRKVMAVIRKNPPITPYDAVISSYPNLSTHWAAAEVKRLGHAKTWIADFRDPMVYDWQGSLQKVINKRLQAWVEKRSDAVLSISRDAMAKFPHAAALGKLHWLPNGFDPDDLLSARGGEARDFPGRNDQLILSYAGGMYGGKRDVSALFNALRSLMDKGLMQADDILVLYAGGDEGILRAQAKAFSLDGCVQGLGRVERRAALAMQQHSDAILICSHNTKGDQGIMTGKVYECLMLGRPLITLVNGDLPGSELKRMLDDIGAGVVYEEANHEQGMEALGAYLLSLFRGKRGQGSFQFTPDDEKRTEYSYERITGRLLSLIHRGQGSAMPPAHSG